MSVLSINAPFLSGHNFISPILRYDAFDLLLYHRSKVLGEYTGQASTEGVTLPGVYRIGVSSKTTVQQTQCISYNATAAAIAAALDSLSLISSRGGVTVRGVGDPDSPLFAFGYKYRIGELPISETLVLLL